jgi:hypothetical protein
MSAKYSVEALSKMPDFAGEWRYVQTERARAVHERVKLPERSVWNLASKPLGILQRSDWDAYIEKLDKYAQEMRHHKQVIDGGLVPFRILVTNQSSQADKSVWVHLTVENGHIDSKTKAPERPDRPDSVPQTAITHSWPAITTFMRYGIKVKPHSMEGVFSKLGADESEFLVNEVLYLELYDDTRVKYSVRSKLAKSIHGEVAL